MDQQLRELWDRYRGTAWAIYAISDGRLRFGQEGELEERLGALVGESDELRRGLAVRLPGNRGESEEGGADFDPDLDTVAVAAAAIDVAVAADVLDALDREKEGARAEGFTVPGLVELAVPEASEREPVPALLEEADGLFPEQNPMRGAAPWPSTAKEKADLAIDRLIDSGAPVASSCGFGLVSVGATNLIGTVGGFGALEVVTQKVGTRVALAMRLLRSAIAKILALVGSERLIEAAVELSIHRELDALAEGFGIERWAVGRLVRERRSLALVDEALASNAPDEAVLETSLESLCSDYDRTMRWGRRYAKLLKFAGPGVVLLGFGVPGAAGIAAANGIGLTYALLSLADRLGTGPFASRLDGVPAQVAQPPAGTDG